MHRVLVNFANDLRGDGKQLSWEELPAHQRSVIITYEDELNRLDDIKVREEELYRINRHFDKYGTKTNIPARELIHYISQRVKELE